MTLGTGPLPALRPEAPQPGWGDLRDQAAAQLARAAVLDDRYDATALEVAAGLCSPDLGRRVTELLVAVRELRAETETLAGQLARVAYEDRLGAAADLEAGFAAGQAAERARQAANPGRHRRTRAGERRGVLGVIDGGRAAIIPGLAAAWAAARHGLRTAGHHAGAVKTAAHTWWAHAALAHKAAAVVIAAAVIPGAVGGTTAAAVLALQPGSHGAAAGRTAGQVTNGAVIQGAAAFPGQQPPPRAAAGRAQYGRHGRSATAASSSSPVLQPYTQPVATASPGTPGPSQPSQPSTPQTAGTLTVDNATIDLTTATSATITLSTIGGPADWQATGVPSDIKLDHSAGHIWAGESYKITVSLAAPDGQAIVTFELQQAGTGTTITITVDLAQPSPAASASPAPSPS